MPLGVIDPRAGLFIPVCRELAMANPGGSVFLDLFEVHHGRAAGIYRVQVLALT